jgi:inner membrane protein
MINSTSELRTSVSLKVAVIGALILLLLIPVAMIRGVIDDRQAVGAQAQSDIMQSWGGQQEIGGPVLVLPYDTVTVTQYGERITRAGQLQTDAAGAPQRGRATRFGNAASRLA